MNQVTTLPEVLTLEEAAAYLRLPKEIVEQQATLCFLPGRRVDRHWRFLKAALNDWLRGPEKPDGKTALLAMAEAFKDDDTMPALREAIARNRAQLDAELRSES